MSDDTQDKIKSAIDTLSETDPGEVKNLKGNLQLACQLFRQTCEAVDIDTEDTAMNVMVDGKSVARKTLDELFAHWEELAK